MLFNLGTAADTRSCWHFFVATRSPAGLYLVFARMPHAAATPLAPPLQADVQAVLVGYKELLLRYEALARALQQQLGLGAVSPAASAAAAAAEASLGARSGSAHRSKEQQRGHGFGSLIPPGLEGALLDGRQQAGGTAGAAVEPDASPTSSGRWSPGGLLQRITSKTKPARSQAPPTDHDGGSAAASSEAAAAGGKAGSPSKQSPHPLLGTLFGSGSPKRARAQQTPAARPAPPQRQPQQQVQAQQPAPASATSEPVPPAGSTVPPDVMHAQPPLQQGPAGQEVGSSTARPEPSFGGQQEPAEEGAVLDQPACSTSLLVDAGPEAAPQAEEPASGSRPPAATSLPAAAGSLLDAPMQALQDPQEAQSAAPAEDQAGSGSWPQAEQPGRAAAGAEEGGSAHLGGLTGSGDGRTMAAVDDLLGLQPYGTYGGSAAAGEPALAAGSAAEGRSLESQHPADRPAAAEPLSLL